MNIEVTNINRKNVIECNSLQDNIRVRRSGTAKPTIHETKFNSLSLRDLGGQLFCRNVFIHI